MNTEQVGNKRLRWFSLRKILFVSLASSFLYAGSYFANSLCGGYWMIPEMDGHDRYSFGLAIPTAILWQPRFGHEAIGTYDLLGEFYAPLICLDRKFVHPTIYISDEGDSKKADNLHPTEVHPEFRDGYATKFLKELNSGGFSCRWPDAWRLLPAVGGTLLNFQHC